MLLLPAATVALSMQTQAPPRVVVDLDVVADTLPLESEVYLSALQSLRPEGPWRDQRDLPQHRWRTFDLARKYHRVLRELRVVRPADACMMLRLLFEEDEVGRRAIAARKDPSGTKWEGGGWGPDRGKTPGRAAGHAAAHGGGGRRELGRGARAAVLRAVAERGRRFSARGH